MSLWRCFGLLAVASVFCSCSSPQGRALHEVENSRVTAEARSAGDYLLSLRERSQLPGVSKEAHGEIRFDFAFPLPKEVAYPFSATFQVSLQGESFTNHYTVQRQTKDSAWQLQKAWQTDSEGQTVKEWPIERTQGHPGLPTQNDSDQRCERQAIFSLVTSKPAGVGCSTVESTIEQPTADRCEPLPSFKRPALIANPLIGS